MALSTTTTATTAALTRVSLSRSYDACAVLLLSRPLKRSLHTRKLHSTRPPASAAPVLLPPGHGSSTAFLDDPRSDSTSRQSADSPLANLPMSTLMRSYTVQYASSIPLLLRPSIAVLSFLAETKSPILSPDRNPLMKRLLRVFLYDMFCAGENGAQVAQTANGLKTWGVQGVVLCWAREFVFKQGQQAESGAQAKDTVDEVAGRQAIQEWGQGTLRSIEFANPGDIVAIKLSGAGPVVLEALQAPGNKHDPLFMDYVHQICRLAKSKGVSLSVDAEQQRLQAGIDDFTLSLARKYNGATSGTAVIKNTYQVYLKSVPAKLSRDLEMAAREGFCLGIKLVRGAYLTSEDRKVIWETKEQTDDAYDGVAEGLMRRSWKAGGYLKGSGAFPEVDVVLATHNLVSTQQAIRIRREMMENGERPISLVFAQLMGMADHVSAAAIRAGQEETALRQQRAFASQRLPLAADRVDVPAVYKYLVWGSVGECMKYLVRRAEENRDAASRTQESRAALWEELRRRVWG